MCSDRLKVGEAPACVQACPNEAIAITIVDRRQVLEHAQARCVLPGRHLPNHGAPPTHRARFPRNACDFYRSARPTTRRWSHAGPDAAPVGASCSEVKRPGRGHGGRSRLGVFSAWPWRRPRRPRSSVPHLPPAYAFRPSSVCGPTDEPRDRSGSPLRAPSSPVLRLGRRQTPRRPPRPSRSPPSGWRGFFGVLIYR
jgi:hypothetical protein